MNYSLFSHYPYNILDLIMIAIILTDSYQSAKEIDILFSK